VAGGGFSQDEGDVSRDENVIPVGFDHIYFDDSPIVITCDAVIMMTAVADGMNYSETVMIEVPFKDPFREPSDNDELPGDTEPDPGDGFDPVSFRLSAVGGITKPNGYADITVFITNTEGIEYIVPSLGTISTEIPITITPIITKKLAIVDNILPKSTSLSNLIFVI